MHCREISSGMKSFLPRHTLAFVFAILVLFTGVLHAQIGGLDSSFAPGTILSGGSPGSVRAISVQSDGKVIVAGDFTGIGGVARGRIARLNTDGTVDTAFAATAGADGTIHSFAVQTDGKIIIGGDFTNVDGTSRNRIARLTTAGALDTTFSTGTGCNATVYAVANTFSAIYIGGDFTTVNGTARGRIAALSLSTGALNTASFTGSGANATVYAIASDSTTSSYIFVGGAFTAINGSTCSRLARMTTGGSLDTVGFPASLMPNGTVYSIGMSGNNTSAVLCIGGDFTMAGSAFRGRIARYTASFSSLALDNTFNFYLDGICRSLSVVAYSSGTRIYAGGDFTTVSGQPHGRMARFSPVGTSSSANLDLDPAWSTAGGANGTIYALKLNSEGKAYAGGSFSTVDGTVTTVCARLYGDAGSQPPATPSTLTATALSASQIYLAWGTASNAVNYTLEHSPDGSTGWTAFSSTTPSATIFYDTGLASGTTLYYRVKANNSNGSSAYTPTASATTNAAPWTGSGSLSASPGAGITDGTVSDIIVQPDGKILVAGSFTTALGQARARIARLNADYTLDTTFDPGTGPNNSVTKMALMQDGRVYIFGSFSTVAGIARKNVARLNSTGTLDTTFDPGSGGVFLDSISMQRDGRLLVCGYFSNSSGGFNGSGKEHLVRLNLDGTVDGTFNPRPSNEVTSVSVQPDGRIVIGGYFNMIGGVTRNYIARLNADGTLDTGFTPTGYSGQGVQSLNDGRVLLTGSFSAINGVARSKVAILNNDGTLDTTFVTDATTGPNSTVSYVAPQPDYRFIIAGSFTKVGTATAWKIARLHMDGSLDTTFNAEAGPGSGIISVATVLRDSSILVGGSFYQFGTALENSLARLNGDGVPAVPSAPGSIAATALSSGSITVSWSNVFSEFSYRIERSLNGVSGWVQVAEVPWDFTSYTDTGLTTGTAFFYRVRASNNAGNSAYTGPASAPTYTGYQQWKVNNGYSVTEPDTSDADADGISLILEYVLGTNPNAPEQDALPVGQAINGAMAISYRKYRSDVSYLVEASADLVNWSSAGVNQGSGPFPIAWISVAANPIVYLRLKVTAP